ncbi:DUF4422 domain-containing protein [Brytella acorum]|uniref:DUF4422 domain-containing protein n=1 Tax=Brytella acorum TaxID=2959299 RepID=UPI0025AEA56E|nr:DUF4422 domain-containing protein [Brytella acorum]MDF3626244.1 DUF4422 domain-containing protein [Brytella acorum]
MSTKIYVAGHNNFDFPCDSGYVPMICGQDLINIDTVFCCDNSNDNISKLNKNFCELTALYWIWKNDSSSSVVGLNHYRRFFAKKNIGCEKFTEYNSGKTLIKREISASNDFNIGENYDLDIIVSEKHHVGNIIQQYSMCHYVEDMYIVRNIIDKVYPEYIPAYDFLITNCNYISRGNMFVAKKHIADEYSKWIFDILFAMADMKFYNNYDDYQKRVFGFISERIMGVWLLKNRQNICMERRNIIEF